MIVDIQYRHAAKVLRRRRRKPENLVFPARANVQVSETTGAAAPVAFRFPSHEVLRRDVVELRAFDGRLFSPVVKYRHTGTNNAATYAIEDCSADDLATPALGRDLHRPPLLVGPTLSELECDAAVEMTDPLDACEEVRKVISTHRDETLLRLLRLAEDILIVDGVVHMATQEPVLVFEIKEGRFRIAEDGKLAFTSPSIPFRFDEIDIIEDYLHLVRPDGVPEIPPVESRFPDALQYDPTPMRIHYAAHLLVDAVVVLLNDPALSTPDSRILHAALGKFRTRSFDSSLINAAGPLRDTLAQFPDASPELAAAISLFDATLAIAPNREEEAEADSDLSPFSP